MSAATPRSLPSGMAWGWPGAARKAHVFADGRSLCLKWMYTGPSDGVAIGERPQQDDCVPCHRAALALAEAGSKEEE